MAIRYPDEVRSSVDQALSLVCRMGKTSTFNLLIEYFPEECRKLVSRELAEACRQSRVETAIEWIHSFPEESRAAVGHPHQYDKTTILYWVCRNGLTRVLQFMLQEFPDEVSAAMSQADTEGQTGLSWACRSGHDSVVKLLLDRLPGGLTDEELLQPEEQRRQDPELAFNKDGLPTMVNEDSSKVLGQQGYRLVGSHSAVKQCRWTKSALRGEGQCYKHTFYGISSHRCMEGTPSLACANKCTFCWRGHANPVTTSWKYETDDPEWIVQQSIKNHLDLIEQAAVSPKTLPSRVAEARQVGHMALSLVGEPVLYPEAPKLIQSLHRRRISTFLVTNGQFPDELERLPWVTQLYVSLDAPDKDELKEVGRPLFKDYWERLRKSLEILKEKGPKQRTVARMTVIKGKNMEDSALEGYAELINLGSCDFVEVKGATYSSWDQDKTGLSHDSVPYHEEVRAFAHQLADVLPDYGVACEHEHSCALLLARRDRFLDSNGRWQTHIDFEKFADAAQEGNVLQVSEFSKETPQWALADGWQASGTERPGFDPQELRKKVRPTKAEALARKSAKAEARAMREKAEAE
eukprot:TRINITY_DN7932_c4_g1_i1.p1 TRINITY_DN7932_c4_g1~~TRINITY_DN7932_c4_g1_i1.p1  ORF type:complete len:605 (-),score=96.49 TRINITY_DN7932_c4_g1_i1:57-1790(-)